jgi:hypothetical protein
MTVADAKEAPLVAALPVDTSRIYALEIIDGNTLQFNWTLPALPDLDAAKVTSDQFSFRGSLWSIEWHITSKARDDVDAYLICQNANDATKHRVAFDISVIQPESEGSNVIVAKKSHADVTFSGAAKQHGWSMFFTKSEMRHWTTENKPLVLALTLSTLEG